jgi:hypothetical protein
LLSAFVASTIACSAKVYRIAFSTPLAGLFYLYRIGIQIVILGALSAITHASGKTLREGKFFLKICPRK